ncbi:ribonuclease [Mesorhizobium sp. BAC0120]|uniref:ribonuclease T2 family protein n=1 Tax=Mesorhizobium sp. BAC0120 TaxID=3090670 RepID=UPI00298D467B|nr:ribonuclease [Mesorhizobium sp. BAC0120]MDW6026229.1 ribonuclease [Mesorhizobium sp. BAC0120]
MRSAISYGIVLAAVMAAGVAHAEKKLSGSFVADASCPATQSIKSGRNPGNISTAIGQNYDLLAGNKDEPTHYLIRVPGADPERRWVKVTCGHVSGQGAANEPGASATPAAPQKRAASGTGKPDYIFALSWQPAFCETRPEKSECKAEMADGFDASRFTLHGLWPEPNGNFYCGVSADDRAKDSPGHWRDLPPVELDAATRQQLDQVMPGTASQLERHEWIKHGTCSGLSQQAYFSEALTLMRTVNGSAARDLFAQNVGRELTSDQIRDAFDKAFGAGAGKRVRVACVKDPSSGRRLISELTLGLTGPLGPDSSLASLIMASSPTGAGCPKGFVDRPRPQ